MLSFSRMALACSMWLIHMKNTVSKVWDLVDLGVLCGPREGAFSDLKEAKMPVWCLICALGDLWGWQGWDLATFKKKIFLIPMRDTSHIAARQSMSSSAPEATMGND